MTNLLELLGIPYLVDLVGKISRSNFFVQGPGRLSENSFLFAMFFKRYARTSPETMGCGISPSSFLMT